MSSPQNCPVCGTYLVKDDRVEQIRLHYYWHKLELLVPDRSGPPLPDPATFGEPAEVDLTNWINKGTQRDDE